MFLRSISLAIALMAGASSTVALAKQASEMSIFGDKSHDLLLFEQINNTVNAFPYRSDIELYGVEDHWATPDEFFERNGGDCEDYVFAKRQALVQQRPGMQAFAAHVYATNEATKGVRTSHMVLLVESKEGWWVLDNLTNEILPYAERSDLEWVFGFDDKRVMVFLPSDDGLEAQHVQTVSPDLIKKINRVMAL